MFQNVDICEYLVKMYVHVNLFTDSSVNLLKRYF